MKKYILLFILGGIIFSSITVYAIHIYSANEIPYSYSGWNVSNVDQALDSLDSDFNDYKTNMLRVLRENDINISDSADLVDVKRGLTVAAMAGNIYYLGSGKSFNLKNMFPNGYQALTKDNFIIVPTGSHYEGFSISSDCDHQGTSDCISINISANYAYNSSTGVLTVNGSPYSKHTDKWGNQFVSNTSGYCNFTYKAYLVMGQIKTLD